MANKSRSFGKIMYILVKKGRDKFKEKITGWLIYAVIILIFFLLIKLRSWRYVEL